MDNKNKTPSWLKFIYSIFGEEIEDDVSIEDRTKKYQKQYEDIKRQAEAIIAQKKLKEKIEKEHDKIQEAKKEIARIDKEIKK